MFQKLFHATTPKFFFIVVILPNMFWIIFTLLLSTTRAQPQPTSLYTEAELTLRFVPPYKYLVLPDGNDALYPRYVQHATTSDFFMYYVNDYPMVAFSDFRNEKRLFLYGMRLHLDTWSHHQASPPAMWEGVVYNHEIDRAYNFQTPSFTSTVKVFFHITAQNESGWSVLFLKDFTDATPPNFISKHDPTVTIEEWGADGQTTLTLGEEGDLGLKYTLSFTNTEFGNDPTTQSITTWAPRNNFAQTGYIFSGAVYMPLVNMPGEMISVQVNMQTGLTCIPDCSHDNCGYGGCDHDAPFQCPHTCDAGYTCDLTGDGYCVVDNSAQTHWRNAAITLLTILAAGLCILMALYVFYKRMDNQNE